MFWTAGWKLEPLGNHENNQEIDGQQQPWSENEIALISCQLH